MVERTLISLPSQLQLIERLQHLIYLSSSLIFVSGEAGAGKSTLTENLSNELPSELQQVYVSLVNAPTAKNLRQQIVSKLYKDALFNADDNLLATILRLQKEQNDAKNRLIIIDNANNLPADFLVELCELFSAPVLAQEHTFNILLLADTTTTEAYLDYIDSHLISSLKEALNLLELSLPALTSKEANALLLHNFQQVGYQAKLQHQDALNKQLKQCNGNPQKIIKLAEDLSQGLIEPQKSTWLKNWLPAILLMLGSVAIVSILAIYLYPKFITPQEQQKSPLIDKKATDVSATEKTNNTEKRAADWAKFEDNLVDNQTQVGLSDEVEKRTVISDNQLLELSVLTDTPNNSINDDLQANKTNTENDLAQPLQEGDLQLEGQENNSSEAQSTELTYQQKVANSETLEITSEKSQIIDQQVTDSQLPLAEALPSSTSETATNQDDQKEVSSVQQKVAENIQPVITPKKIEKVLPQKSQDELLSATSTLLAKNPNFYTVQMSGMASRESLVAFQRRYGGLRDNVYAYQTIRQNGPWFVVVYGEYASVEEATLGIKNLPAVFSGMPTWIKKWRSVHNDLRLNNE